MPAQRTRPGEPRGSVSMKFTMEPLYDANAEKRFKGDAYMVSTALKF